MLQGCPVLLTNTSLLQRPRAHPGPSWPGTLGHPMAQLGPGMKDGEGCAALGLPLLAWLQNSSKACGDASPAHCPFLIPSIFSPNWRSRDLGMGSGAWRVGWVVISRGQ